jgi:hypothetical protein
VYDEETIFYTGPTRPAKTGQKSLYWDDEPNEPTKERLLSYVLLESPFASISTVSRGHPSVVSQENIPLHPSPLSPPPSVKMSIATA